MSDQIIRRFQLVGITKTPMKKRELELQLLESMYQEGYAQLLDVDTTFKTTYNSEKDQYQFVLTMQGCYVGDSPWGTVLVNGNKYDRKKIQ